MHKLGRVTGMLLCLIGLGFSAFLVSITGPKVYEMSQVKGWIPGARVQTFRVSAKLESVDHDDRWPERDYWIYWKQASIGRRHVQRDNLPYDEWSKLRVGDPIDVITIGNDPFAYTRNDVFVEPGNFTFDLILLALELCGVALPILGLLALKKYRAAAGTVTDSAASHPS